MEVTKERIKELICSYISEYENRPGIIKQWQKPLVGFADANHPEMQSLKKTVRESHCLPSDILPGAAVVIAYFVPFTEEIARTNQGKEEIASKEWAVAYEQTNTMFGELNQYLIDQIKTMGWHAAVSAEATRFDSEALMSNWSQRHIARLAGLGTFGINNMLITRSGCCGRYSSVVADFPGEADQPVKEEYCLYKQDGSCGVCLEYCPTQALTADGYDRHRCYEVLMRNAAIHRNLGSSYPGQESGGSDVCGKCVVNAPCAFWSRK